MSRRLQPYERIDRLVAQGVSAIDLARRAIHWAIALDVEIRSADPDGGYADREALWADVCTHGLIAPHVPAFKRDLAAGSTGGPFDRARAAIGALEERLAVSVGLVPRRGEPVEIGDALRVALGLDTALPPPSRADPDTVDDSDDSDDSEDESEV